MFLRGTLHIMPFQRNDVGGSGGFIHSVDDAVFGVDAAGPVATQLVP